MYIFITVLIIIISALLGLVVLIQNPKGGGVNATFGGASQQIFGAARATDVVEKTTWVLAILLLTFSLGSAAFLGKTQTATATSGKGSPATTTTSTLPKTEAEQRNEAMGAQSPAAKAVQQQQMNQPQPTPAGQPAQQQAPPAGGGK